MEGLWVLLSVNGPVGVDFSIGGMDGDGANWFKVNTISSYFEHMVVPCHVVEHLQTHMI